MPELPEVETMRRGISAVVGCRIDGVDIPRRKLKPITITPKSPTLRRRVTGQDIVATDRFGKRVALRLSNDDTIVFEPRMTGLVLLAEPPTREHLRLGLRLSGGEPEQLWYWDRRGLGNVQLFSPDELEKAFADGKLGPDALKISLDDFRSRFHKSRREIKPALLDQRAVAGIGNLYASEILHVAGVHPSRRCDLVSKQQWQRIYDAMNLVLKEAIRYEGSTLSDGTYRNALNQDGSYQNMHRVYARHGEECKTCRDDKVRRIVQTQRSTFFCPTCQTRR